MLLTGTPGKEAPPYLESRQLLAYIIWDGPWEDITLFKPITMLCGTDNIMWNILHIMWNASKVHWLKSLISQHFYKLYPWDRLESWSRTCRNDLWSTLIENGGFKHYKLPSWIGVEPTLLSIKEGPTWTPSSSTIRHMLRSIGLHSETRIFERVWPPHEVLIVHRLASLKLLLTTCALVFSCGTSEGVNSSVELVSPFLLYR